MRAKESTLRTFSRWRLALLCGLFSLSAIVPDSVLAGTSNSLMDLSADGQLLACSNRDSGSVTVLTKHGATWKKTAEVAVGKHPEGVSFIGGSHNIAVAVYSADQLVLLNADSGEKTGTVDVFDEPYSVVSTPDGSRLYVTLDFPGKIVEIDPVAKTVTREIDAGPHARGLAITNDNARLFVTEYYSGVMHAIDRQTGQRLESWSGSKEDNLARQIALHPSSPKAYITHIRSRTSVPHGSGGIFPYVSVIDTDAPKPVKEGSTPTSRRKRVQMDSFRGNFVVANPWETAASPDGNQLAVVFAGTDDMFLCNVLNDGYRELQWEATLRTGHNPRAVRYTADGSQLLIYNALDFAVTVLDAQSLKPLQTVAVCDSPLDDELLRGKQLFYSANQPMVGRRWISCSSCHPDGDSDGRTWQQPEGLRQTQPMAGLAWTHPLHWSADRDEVQDFEHTIRGPLMQGRGLIRGPLPEALGEAVSGKSPDADALARYTNSHTFDLSPYARTTDANGRRTPGLTPAAERGREIYFRESVGCATCHSGPYCCDSRAGSLTRHDVGTGGDDPSELIGPKYDTPTLIGLYRSAPYLHHGKATTLEEVLTTYNVDDRHGKTSQLTKTEIAELVAFLKSLPYEDPETQAIAAGMKKVEK